MRIVDCCHLLFLLSAAGSAAAAEWRFDATLDADRESLAVRACSDTAQARVRFSSGSPGALAYLTSARRSTDRPLVRRDRWLIATDWLAGECLHSSIDLAAAAKAQHQRVANRSQGYYLVEPAEWLWRPDPLSPESSIGFDLPAGWAASVPWEPMATGRHRLGATRGDWPALAAFGRFVEQRIELPGGALRVAILPPWRAADIRRVEPVANALAAAFGGLPRRDAQILVVPIPGERAAAPWGQATRGGGSAVQLFVGAEAAPGALLEDWTATHEFAHLLHPYLGTRGRWLGEGLASYYQNVLRARVGEITADDAWSRLESGFERGRRDQRSRGMTLSETASRMGSLRAHMRVYWSGAAFWLESDLALRAQGSSLDAVLRDYSACCLGGMAYVWPDAFMAGLDRVSHGNLFSTSYARYAALREFPTLARSAAALAGTDVGRAIMQSQPVSPTPAERPARSTQNLLPTADGD